MRREMLNTDEDIAWLKEVHLRDVPLQGYGDFKFAVLFGNEDGPVEIWLFKDKEPKATDTFLEVSFCGGVHDGELIATKEKKYEITD